MSEILVNQSTNPKISDKQSIANANYIREALLHQVKVIPQGICPMDELSLIYDPNNQNDINELRDVLSKKLCYPSTQIADLHMEANRLGVLDSKKAVQEYNADSFTKITENAKFCPCCGFMTQQNTLSTCSHIDKINHVGVSTYLYFTTLKNLILLLTLMFFVFSIYAIASNVVASSSYKKQLNNPDVDIKLRSFKGFLKISLGSKQLHQTQDDKKSFMIQCWLGTTLLVLWGISFAVIKKRERKAQVQIDIYSKTAGDYSILIKNYPKHLELKDFQDQLNKYRKKIGQSGNCHYENEREKEIVVSKINLVTPFYLNSHSFEDETLDKINKKCKQYENLFISWITQRTQVGQFTTEQTDRKKVYSQFQIKKKQREDKYNEISQRIRKQSIEKQQGQTMPAFITFNSSFNRKFLLGMHDDQNYISQKLPFTDRSKFFHFDKVAGQNNVLAQIRQAPEPQDIIWTNMGQKTSHFLSKKLLTYFIATIALGCSFAAIYGLSKIQVNLKSKQSRAANTFASGLISLCITMINIILGLVLRFLTQIQRNPTHTHQQVNLGMKAAFAELINSILTPILVNYYFKEKNLYGISGLAYDVFFIGITNSFLSPILKIFDVYYYFTRLFAWYKKKPLNKLAQNQNQLNAVTEYMEFQFGYEYIYMVNLFLFTCFFASLQPIIVLFAIAGMSLMYWAQKYSLFNRCKRPIPGNNVVNTAMYQLIYLGPALYTIGSFCWSHLFKTDWIGVAPNLVAAIISGIIFLIPFKKITFEIFNQQLPEKECIFSEDRIFLPSEYDRLNPATSTEEVKNYINYLAEFKKSMQNKTPQEVKDIERQFIRQTGRGTKINEAVIPTLISALSLNRGINYNGNKIILQELFGQNRNSFNSTLIGNTVLYGHRGNQQKPFFSMISQNWLTDKQYKKSRLRNGKEEKPFGTGQNLIIPQIPNFQPVSQYIEQQSQEGLPQSHMELDGSLNLFFQGIQAMGNSKKTPQSPEANSIPLNIPINVFGNLLSPSSIIPDNDSSNSDKGKNKRGN